MKPVQPVPLRDVIDPERVTIETIPPPARSFEREAAVDGFSFATHSVGSGPPRRLPLWLKIVAWVFLAWTVIGLLAQAASIILNLLQL
jgi:hypothetical protein